MKSTIEKAIIGIVAIIIGYLSSRIDSDIDFLWSIRGRILPLLIALLSLYCTLSITLVKTLDEFSGKLRIKAMGVISSMQFELRLEFWLLLVVFILMILSPLFSNNEGLSLAFRCTIDGLSVAVVILFLIAIIDTFFSYLSLINTKQEKE